MQPYNFTTCTDYKQQIPKMPHEKTLIFVQILFRHGNRTPATSFATDKYRNHLFKPYGIGQLTQKGKEAAYNLGKLFHEMYSSFLGSSYFPALLHSFSSGVSRAEMSLQCVHAALFPPSEDEQVASGLPWQPIPYYTFSRRGDKYLGLIKYDSKLLDVWKKLTPDTKELYDLIGRHSGEIIKNTHEFFKVQNTLQVQKEMGFELPEWTNCISPEKWHDEMLHFWEDLATHRTADLGGPLIQLITQNFRDKICCTKGFEDKKMCLFSGHDINIVPILGALNSYIREEINYCSFISLELHQIEKEHFLKILFQNGLDATLRHINPKKEKHEDNLYPFKDFINDTKWMYHWLR